MRTTLLFFVYLLACLILAALLTPSLMATGWIAIEPHRVMSRLAQVLILIGLWPFLRWQGLANREALGFGPGWPVIKRAIIGGWGLGVLILLALALALLELGVRLPDPTPDFWTQSAARVVQALIGGLLIGLLEETFFRGALYSAIRRRDGVRSAMLWSAALYAMLHFMKPGSLPESMAFDGAGALWMFTHVFIDVFQWSHLDSLVALFMVGLFLALVREQTGHIGWCIGLHAGWVLVIQVNRRLTDGNDDSPLSFLAGDYDGTIGWLAALWIGLLMALYWAGSAGLRAWHGRSGERPPG
ncbi:CPBP family intramembrane glutamic endopeptidase [Allochromatium palmeri]|uniref:CPBP family intramembrane metalloprotease n=1 Tax=Allochromatium palmeri TaxID=231048 RepID=A0A6N8EFM8_9GAMM|nr:CPBP family intramembrane glutamic endopeptidase [Allochromatium palmeri]MTW21357.1 CPBP family intramembrane metalloprotease [Allochromatium palmeri]